MMSFSEIIIVIIVAIIIIKPEDLPYIIRQIKKIRRFFYNIKDEFLGAIDQNLLENDDSNAETEAINKYIEKILSLGEKYEGNYNLKDIREFYHKLLKDRNNRSL